MKKKTFFQVSIVLYSVLLLFLAMMAAAVYGLIVFFSSIVSGASAEDWIGLVAVIGGLAFLTYLFIKFARNKIVLDKTEIFVPQHWGGKDNKIQYETHVPYKSIQNIFMTISTRNSKGKTARWVFTPMPYIVFELENGKQESVNVLYFTKKQTVTIIDEVRERAKEQSNTIGEKTGAEVVSELMEQRKKR